eukprot:155667-Pleurochrysis_carterae.AAC.1
MQKRRLNVSETHTEIPRGTRAMLSRKPLPAPGRKASSSAGIAVAHIGIATAPSVVNPLPRLTAARPTACERR